MEFTKRESFIKQLVIYLGNNDFAKARELALDFTGKFPAEMASHYLLARAAFGLSRFDEAKVEARRAFNMATAREDMLAAGLLASTAHLELREYGKGYELLKEMEKAGDSVELQTAMVVFSLAQKNGSNLVAHLDKLRALNERLAFDLAMRIIRGEK